MSKLPEATPEQRETLHRKAIGKQHKETKVEYELMLRFQTQTELIVDVRKDIVDLDGYSDDGGEYIEGFVYDSPYLNHNYKDALKDYNRLAVKYEEIAEKSNGSAVVHYLDEVEEEAERLRQTKINSVL
jgi:hypothetical protein